MAIKSIKAEYVLESDHEYQAIFRPVEEHFDMNLYLSVGRDNWERMGSPQHLTVTVELPVGQAPDEVRSGEMLPPHRPMREFVVTDRVPDGPVPYMMTPDEVAESRRPSAANRLRAATDRLADQVEAGTYRPQQAWPQDDAGAGTTLGERLDSETVERLQSSRRWNG